MTVRTHHLAQCDLRDDPMKRTSFGDQRADVCGLGPGHVVELEDGDVGEAAVDARVLS